MFGRIFKTSNETINQLNAINADNEMKKQILMETNDKLQEIANRQSKRYEDALDLLEKKDKQIEEQKKLIEKYEKLLINLLSKNNEK
jgi:hypothetical protein